MKCPVCSSDMWDNRENKKNPKAPDWKCKDKDCKYEFDKESGEYVKSEFGTAVWEKKKPFNDDTFQGTKPTPPVKHSNGEAMMRLAYRKDLMVALVNKYSDGTVDVRDMFDKLWEVIEK